MSALRLTTTEPRELALLAGAVRAIAEATSVDDLRDIRDKAEAVRAYTKQAGYGLELQNKAAEIKLRAERRIGEVLGEVVRPGNPQLLHGETVGLSELGISRIQSHRWQRLATVPDELFEGHIADVRASGGELTTNGLLKAARQAFAKADTDAPQVVHEDASSDIDDFVKSGVKFGTIYADPPWKYGNQGTRAATDNHYPTMTVEDIAALPIRELAADDAHLHLWTTNAFLPSCFSLMEAWGFTYKSVLVWVKPQMGIGNYWRVSHEFLLLGTRGTSPFRDRSCMSWLQHDRTEHSRKPEAVRRLIERVSPGPYLELFARTLAPGWSAWGNQIERNLYDNRG